MYRLIMVLPFDIVLVHEDEFNDTGTASLFAACALPYGFLVVEEEDKRLDKAITVPIKKTNGG